VSAGGEFVAAVVLDVLTDGDFHAIDRKAGERTLREHADLIATPQGWRLVVR